MAKYKFIKDYTFKRQVGVMPNTTEKTTKYVIGDVISGCVKGNITNGKSYITDDKYTCSGTLRPLSGALADVLWIPIEYVEEVKTATEPKAGSGVMGVDKDTWAFIGFIGIGLALWYVLSRPSK